MNGELISVLDYIEREKGIKREILLDAVESSLLTASKKSLGTVRNPSITIDNETGDIRVYDKNTVVEKVKEPGEISLKEAKRLNPKAKIGDEVDVEITPRNFGRIAAQTAKQVIIQKIREAEKDIIFNEFIERKGDILNGIVRRHERGTVIVDLGKTEAFLPLKEQCPGENYPLGSRIRAYIVDVKDLGKFPEIILSRTHPGLVKNLFDLEVPEINDGIVEIKAIAREPGARTKIAVYSQAEKVDSVGACVGMRGERVKNIVRELGGEKIDIVRWDPDIAVFVRNALSPAKLNEVKVREEEGTIEVFVEEDQLSLTIGKKGQNARLTSKLTGWKIDINRDLGLESGKVGEKETKEQAAVPDVSQIKGVGEKMAAQLADAGFKTAKDLSEASIEDLVKVPGVGQKMAEKLIESAKATL